MKRLLLGVWVCTLGACAVESPIAKQSGTAGQTSQSSEEQLRGTIPAFCADTCKQLEPCRDAAEPAACPGQCAGYMAAFLGHGDACVQRGQDFEACFQGLDDICAAADNPPACDDLAAYDACAGMDPTYDDASSGGSGGGTGAAPAMESGTAGGAPVEVPTAAYPRCEFGEVTSGQASGPGTSQTPEGNLCELTADSCSDGSSYRLRCNLFNSTLTCNCFKDGIVTGSFTPQTGCPPAYQETDAKCGWNLLYDQ